MNGRLLCLAPDYVFVVPAVVEKDGVLGEVFLPWLFVTRSNTVEKLLRASQEFILSHSFFCPGSVWGVESEKSNAESGGQRKEKM
jgi:hypothetical protein